MSYAGKVVVITGGSKGIGRATAEQFIALGAKVAINYSSNSKAAVEVLRLGADNALIIKADAGSFSGIQTIVDQTVAKFGKIDVLIPNAAAVETANLQTMTEKLFDTHFTLNVKGPLFLAKVGYNTQVVRLCC